MVASDVAIIVVAESNTQTSCGCRSLRENQTLGDSRKCDVARNDDQPNIPVVLKTVRVEPVCLVMQTIELTPSTED
jgi:hypothetical protein